jgi:hypothetical protein
VAKLVIGPDSQVTVNGTDLSDHVTSVTVGDESDEVDVTGFNEDYREFLPGLRDSTVTATFLADYASGSVDAVIGAQYYARSTGTIKVKPDTNGTVVYTLINKIYSYPPMDGGVGDAATIDVSFRNAGTAGLTRGTA